MASIANVDPMGSFVLAGKAKKALDKGKLGGIRLEFTAEGGKALGALPLAEGETELSWRALAEVMASISDSSDSRPWAEEKAHFVSKFEIRLDKEAPEGLRTAADKAALDAAVAALPFRERRAFQMSNKEFEMAFLRWEAGAPVPRPAEQAEALRVERNAARGGGGRGRGRGGRGRGSFLAPQAAAGQGQANGQNP
jgi:hypothetical protein